MLALKILTANIIGGSNLGQQSSVQRIKILGTNNLRTKNLSANNLGTQNLGITNSNTKILTVNNVNVQNLGQVTLKLGATNYSTKQIQNKENKRYGT